MTGSENATQGAPLCFILPSAKGSDLRTFHTIFSSEIVGQDDVLLNVFPKHQTEIETYPYPVPVEAILDPEGFPRRLCGCRAVVSSRLHGAILSLHAGVPTLAAWPVLHGKVHDLITEVLHFPDQFVEVKYGLTREMLDRHVDRVRSAYAYGRRDMLFEKLESISRHTKNQASHVLQQLMHVQLTQGSVAKDLQAPTLWKPLMSSPSAGEEDAKMVQMAAGRTTEVRLYGKPSTGETPELEAARQTDLVSPCSSWKWWGAVGCTGERPPPVGVGETMSFSGSPVLSLATLVLIMLLGLPGVASLSKSRVATPAIQKKDDSAEERTGKSEARLASTAHQQLVPQFDKQRPRMMHFVFFGLNYVVWVVLSMGFSICSKSYMNETRNPMVMLAIQGWIGTAILCGMNAVARYRRRSANASSCHNTDDTTSSYTATWLGKCGLEQARHSGRNVWQAGMLHSGNAVLTSWSVLVGGVAATHALKALEPVVAAVFSRWLLGSKLPPHRAASVAIIVLGLGIFMIPSKLLKCISEKWGLASSEGHSGSSTRDVGVNLAVPALVTTCACCAVALRNVLLKRVDPPPPPPPLGLLVCCIVAAGAGSFALMMPFLPFSWEGAKESLLRMSSVNAALCFVGYNLASFNLLSELSPVGHAVANASKRVCVLVTGLYLLGEDKSISPWQLVGVSLAFVGLASYNLAGTRSLTASLVSK